MIKDKIYTSLRRAMVFVARRYGIPAPTIQNMYKEILLEIDKCLEYEQPFLIDGIGKIYFTYQNIQVNQPIYRDILKGKVRKRLKFDFLDDTSIRHQTWVPDIGIKNNIDQEKFIELAMSPEEIVSQRKKKLLKEQRSLNFNSNLLYEESELPNVDKHTSLEPPTPREIINQIIDNIKNGK